jgi:tetratricopeptide (TPR) repeat protein
MDRSSLLSRRLVLPLAGLTSVGLLWFAVPGRIPAPPQLTPACSAQASVDDAPRRTSPQLPAKRTVASAAALVRRSAAEQVPLPARPATIVVTAFAADPDKSVDRDLSWPAGNGPALTPAVKTANAPQPLVAVKPADKVPAPLTPVPEASESGKRASPAKIAERDRTPRGVEVQRPATDATPRVLEEPSSAQPARLAESPRSRQLELIAQEADRHSRQGYELAGRAAHYAARREFTTALRLVAQGLDMEHQTARHGRALSAALTAITEAEDFVPPRDRLDAELNVAELAARHRTPVLHGAAEQVAPMDAMKSYFTYAQEQLAAAVGSEVAGSMALHGLGKLHSALAQQSELRIRAPESKAMTFYQAALLVDPQNYTAANDLGVLLARAGYFEEARQALEHSLAIHPQAAGWRNLAQVYQRLGERDRAVRAESLCQAATRRESAGQKQLTPAGSVQWVDPSAFAQTFAQTPAARDPLPARNASSQPQPAASGPVAQKPFSNLFEKR